MIKSRSYPILDLKTVIELTVKAKKLGNGISLDAFAQEISSNRPDSKSSIRSGAFIRKLSAFTQFGLLSVQKGKVNFDKKIDIVIYPRTDEERDSVIKECFLSVGTFAELYNRLAKNTPVELRSIRVMAARDLGITEAGINKFMKAFISSGEYAKLLEYANEANTEIVLKSDDGNKTQANSYEKGDNIDSKKEGSIGGFQEQSEYSKYVFPLSNGDLTIVLPKKLTEDDLTKLNKFTELLGWKI